MDSNAVQTPKTLGELIRQARERAGLSLRNLEAITGISRTMLHRLELNQVDAPSAATNARMSFFVSASRSSTSGNSFRSSMTGAWRSSTRWRTRRRQSTRTLR
jgi:transcriptional regulator with XRE-family HTH domain